MLNDDTLLHLKTVDLKAKENYNPPILWSEATVRWRRIHNDAVDCMRMDG